MRDIIIPDVHNKVKRLEFIFNKYKDTFGKAIFLGDFHDDWNDSPTEVEAIASWVRERMNTNPEDIFILSNHDQAYRFPNNDFLRCSGWEPGKSRAINRILTKEYWDRFKLFHREHGYWFSHAGLSDKVFGHPIKGFNEEVIAEQCKEALEKATENQFSVYLEAGRCRGGSCQKGGITWLDWDYEFKPIEGVNQVVGHTPHKEPEIMHAVNSFNFDLDTHLNHVGFVEDGKVTFEKVDYEA